jgi:hypothetical protein
MRWAIHAVLGLPTAGRTHGRTWRVKDFISFLWFLAQPSPAVGRVFGLLQCLQSAQRTLQAIGLIDSHLRERCIFEILGLDSLKIRRNQPSMDRSSVSGQIETENRIEPMKCHSMKPNRCDAVGKMLNTLKTIDVMLFRLLIVHNRSHKLVDL